MRLRKIDLKKAAAENQAAAKAFVERTSVAPPGSYFRVLADAVRESFPYGQPVDFPRLATELAVLEERIARLERLRELEMS